MNQYPAQTTIRSTVAISTTSTGVANDPTTVACNMAQPDGTSTALIVVRDAAGQYHADFTPTQVGLHMYEWLGATGEIQVTAFGQYLVTEARF